MMRIKILSLVAGVIFLASSISAQSIDGFVKISGGTTQVSSLHLRVSPFCISKTEVTNKEYREFLKWMSANRTTDELTEASPSLNDEQTKILPKKYLKSDKYDQYPVVGISQKAALMYCDYLKAIHPELKGRFRLPDDREWVYASTIPNEDALLNEIGNAKEPIYNFRKPSGKSAPMPVNSMKANGFGLFNMIGNVAEWTSSQGRVKGGSWNDDAEALNVKKPGSCNGQTEGSPFIGFRVVYFEESAN